MPEGTTVWRGRTYWIQDLNIDFFKPRSPITISEFAETPLAKHMQLVNI